MSYEAIWRAMTELKVVTQIMMGKVTPVKGFKIREMLQQGNCNGFMEEVRKFGRYMRHENSFQKNYAVDIPIGPLVGGAV